MPVAKDAVVITANAENPVLGQLLTQGPTLDAARKIWITGEITTWDEVIDSQAPHTIHVYTRADACGAGPSTA